MGNYGMGLVKKLLSHLLYAYINQNVNNFLWIIYTKFYRIVLSYR